MPVMGLLDLALARREISSSDTSSRRSPERGSLSTTRPFFIVSHTSMSNGSRSMLAFSARTPPRSTFLKAIRPPENSPLSMFNGGSLLSFTSGCFSIPSLFCTSFATAYSSRDGRKV